MNEFEKNYEKASKAQKRKEENRFLKWHEKNKYTIRKIVLFPLYFIIILQKKISYLSLQ